MVTFQIGTGVSRYDCDASIIGESTSFTDPTTGITICALYRLEICDPVPLGVMYWWYWDGSKWVELEGCRWNYGGGYYGYIYAYCAITNGSGYLFKVAWVTPGGTYTREFTIVSYCSQPVRVINKNTNAGISSVKVSASTWVDGAETKICITGSDGRCTIPNLITRNKYTVEIKLADVPSGYKCEYYDDCTIVVNSACTSEVVLKLTPLDAKGAITNYYPPTELNQGEEVRVSTTIKNIGNKLGEFRMYLFDDDTNELIEYEPCPRPLPCYWVNLNPEATYTEILDSDWWWGAMPNHDWNLRIEVRKQTTPSISDHTVRFTVRLKTTPTPTPTPTPAKGQITDYPYPPSLAKGEEVRVPTTIKNVGGSPGEFRMFLFDDTTNEEIEHEPKYTWQNLNPEATYTETLDSDWWWGAMPNHDWNLRIEVRKQTTPSVADDTKQFTVKLKTTPTPTPVPTPYAKIISYYPPEELVQGSVIEVPVIINNTGGADMPTLGGCRAYLFEGATEIDHEPDTTWKSLKVGEPWSVTLDSKLPKTWRMPNRDVTLTLKTRDKDLGWQDEVSFIVKIPVAPPGFLNKSSTYLIAKDITPPGFLNKTKSHSISKTVGIFRLAAQVTDSGVKFTGTDTYDSPGKKLLRVYKVKVLNDEVVCDDITLKPDSTFECSIPMPAETSEYYACRCWGLIGMCEEITFDSCKKPIKTDTVLVHVDAGYLSTTSRYTIKRLRLRNCLFPRIMNKQPLPRVQTKDPVPRITCTMEYIKLKRESIIPFRR